MEKTSILQKYSLQYKTRKHFLNISTYNQTGNHKTTVTVIKSKQLIAIKLFKLFKKLLKSLEGT